MAKCALANLLCSVAFSVEENHLHLHLHRDVAQLVEYVWGTCGPLIQVQSSDKATKIVAFFVPIQNFDPHGLRI